MQNSTPDNRLKWADMAEELAGLGYWRLDTVTEHLVWSPGMFRIYGFEPGGEPRLAEAFERIHPDDLSQAQDALADMRQGITRDRRTRLRLPDGGVRHIESRAGCEFGPDGAVVAIYGTVVDVTNRVTAEATAAVHAAHLDLLGAAGGDIIVEVDRTGMIRFVSEAIKRAGFAAADLEGSPAANLIHPEDLPKVQAILADLFMTGRVDPDRDRTYRLRKANGETVWMDGNPTLIRNADGTIGGLITVLRNINDRREAELALAAREAQLRVISEHTRDVIFQHDLKRRILYASPAVRRYGYDPDALVGGDADDLIHPDDRAKAADQVAQLFSGAPVDPTLDRTFRVRIASGAYVWMEGNPSIVRDDQGRPTSVVSLLHDVTDQRAAAEALAGSEARYRLLANNTADVIAVCNPDGVLTYVSPSSTAVLGYRPDEMVGNRAIDTIHPDDRRMVAKVLGGFLDAGPGAPSPRLEYRFRHKDGHYVWLEATPKAVFDDQGRLVQFQDNARDVTARKAMAAELAESERRFRLITDHSQDMIVVCNPDRDLTFVSPSCEQVLGYRPDEMLGRRTSDFINPDDLAAIGSELRAYIAAGPDAHSPRFEYRAIRKDGREIWLEANPRAIFDAEGQLVELQDNTRDITARKAADTALVESERRYRLLTDNATDVIACYDERGTFTFLSPSVEALTGYAAAELVGRPIVEVMHPDDIDAVIKVFAARRAAGRGAPPMRFEYRAFCKDGRFIWLEARPKAIYDAHGRFVEFQDVVRDITDRKAADAALAESELRYRLIAENATDIISRTSINGRVTYFSPSVTEVTGHPMDEVVGHSLIPLLHPDDVAPTLAAYAALISGEAPNGAPLTYRIRHRDGHWVWLEGNPTLIHDAAGARREVLDVRRDISARVNLEAELRAARDAAEAAAAVKSDFIANMSHEIRTPLTAVLGFSSLLAARKDLDPTAREHADRISAAGRALLALVNDVLDFSKLEAGRMEITRHPADPAAVARDALDLFTLQAEAKGLTLAFDPANDLPASLELDPQAVGQVLLNLLGNAVKFSQAGGVALSLGYDAPSQRLRVAVRDSGPGLSPEGSAKLFQRFSQVDGSSTRSHGGTGLGLAICKGLVEAMDGEIGVDSVLGHGATFHFTIPAPPAAAVAAADAEPGEAWSLDGVRLLVVDDNPINRELVRAILQPFGVEVSEAVDGESGLDACAGLPFDLILLDIRMPGLGGHEVLSRLRAAEGPNQTIPVLAFSAEVDLETLHTTGGFDAAVTKPLDPMVLIRTVAQWSDFQPDLEPAHAHVS